MIGWVIVGLVGFAVGVAVTACLNRFWEDIRKWLNSTALDIVEKHLGYNARTKMQLARVLITRIGDKLFNKTTVITQTDKDQYDAITMLEERGEYADPEILGALRERDNKMENVYEYSEQ